MSSGDAGMEQKWYVRRWNTTRTRERMTVISTDYVSTVNAPSQADIRVSPAPAARSAPGRGWDVNPLSEQTETHPLLPGASGVRPSGGASLRGCVPPAARTALGLLGVSSPGQRTHRHVCPCL